MYIPVRQQAAVALFIYAVAMISIASWSGLDPGIALSSVALFLLTNALA